MAGFKTHISTSTGVGVVYGVAGAYFGVPMETAFISGILCSVAGMLPDVDSDTGVPLRETSTFLAATVPMMMLHRFEQLALSREEMVLAAACVYIVIRFFLVELFKRYTVHRGMWHSYPAAAIAGLATFLISSGDVVGFRMFKAGGVVLGFITHLILDEIWSIERTGVGWRMKKSAGTALKFFSKNMWANVSTYGKLALLVLILFGDDLLMDKLRGIRSDLQPHVVNRLLPEEGLEGEDSIGFR